MAETDPGMISDHVCIDMEAAANDDGEAAAATSPSCVVCMEPMEWVAVSPCGHREVCGRCAARIRFFHNDRRCCICRSHCATVLITKASRSTATTQREPRGGFPFMWPPPPPPTPVAFGGGQGLVVVAAGVDYWYNCGMGAYFDDVCQYQEMNKICIAAASPCSEESVGAVAGAGGVQQDLNVISTPARQQAEDDAELERPLSRKETAQLVLLGVAGVIILGAPLLYLIPA